MKALLAALVVACAVVLPSAPALAAGAFAIDAERGQAAGDEGFGIGWGGSREEARRAALNAYRKAGNDRCQVVCQVVARFDSCGVNVSTRTKYGVGWGRAAEDAEAMAFGRTELPPRARGV